MPSFGRSDAPYDAVIVGAGIAGCATALELRRAGWRVAVLERRDPALGMESVPRQVAEQLTALGVEVGSPCPAITAWWKSERANAVLTPGARIIDRSVLAAQLRERCMAAGAVLIKDTQCILEGQLGAWQICSKSRSADPLQAQHVIDATGRASTIGRQCGAHRERTDELVCISYQLSEPGLAGVWTESTPDGWWNLCRSPHQGTLSFFSTAAIVREVRKDIVALFLGTHYLSAFAAPPVGQGWVRDCSSSRLVPCAGEGWFAVGDAVMTFQPLGSAGIGKALRDARAARRAFEEDTDRYAKDRQEEFSAYMQQIVWQYAQEVRWPESSFWKKWQ